VPWARTWWAALWTFVRVEGVEPTNNVAERALRPAVLRRKGSFGSDSEAGSRFAERLLTVAADLSAAGTAAIGYPGGCGRSSASGNAWAFAAPWTVGI